MRNNKRVYEITLESNPPAQIVEVKNLKTQENVFTGSGKLVKVNLRAKKSFFSRNEFEVIFRRTGHLEKCLTLKPRISKYYWWNIPLGVIWMFTVDPATGAMYEFRQLHYKIEF